MTARPAPDGTDGSDTDVIPPDMVGGRADLAGLVAYGVGRSRVALAVGRVLPNVTSGAKWPFRLLGLGYAAVAVAVLVLGGLRQRRGADALRRGGYAELSSPMVMWLTAAAVVLATGTLALVAVSV